MAQVRIQLCQILCLLQNQIRIIKNCESEKMLSMKEVYTKSTFKLVSD